MGEDMLARELTEAVMRHYGYTDDDIAAAAAVHPGRACDNDECYDEDGKSIHGPAYTELGMTADVMVEVVSPLVAAHVARATADAETRLAAVRELTDGYRSMANQAVLARHVERRLRAALDPAPTTDAEVCEHGFRPEPGRCPAGCTVATHTRYGLPAPTTDADGRDERRDGAGGTRWERG